MHAARLGVRMRAMRTLFVLCIAFTCLGVVGCAAKPVLDFERPAASGKTDAVIGAACEADADCDLGELCDLPVCIPEGPPCPTVGRCIHQTRFYDFEATAIPDADPRGIERVLEVVEPNVEVGEVVVSVAIEHTYRGDLRVTLTSPEGTEVVLHDRTGGSRDDLNLDVRLSDFAGELATGPWTLHVSDHARRDVGTLRNWRLELALDERAEPEPWADVEVLIESHHPYANDVSEVYELMPWTAGATQSRIHFTRIDVESGYDFVEVRNHVTGEVLDRFTGAHTDVLAGPYDTDQVEVVLTSDYSITRWGFAIDRVDVRGAGCLDDEDCGAGHECVAITCIRHPCFSVCQPIDEPPACVDGETSTDGCNQCQCSDGRWLCTELACVAEEGDACGGSMVCADGLVCDHPESGGPACGDDARPEADGVCVRPGVRACPAVFNPVCACTGQTFGNDCERMGWAPFASEGACHVDVAIPDANAAGVTATVSVLRPASSTRARVVANVRHTWRGDLVITVEAPDGSRHLLSNREGGSADDFAFDGEIALGGSVVGTWTLHVADLATYDRGSISFFNVLPVLEETTEGQVCGTRGALPCGPGEICVFDAGECGATDRGGVCQPRPETCSFENVAVCGCDGRTYHNACRAEQAGVSVASQGTCPTPGDFCGGRGNSYSCAVGEYCHHDVGEICGWADAPGECRRIPGGFCTAHYDPVCGCDGVTYSNACRAASAGVSVRALGACE